jgi:hypothetical protein
VAVFGESFAGANEFTRAALLQANSLRAVALKQYLLPQAFGISFRACLENILPPPKPRRFS